MKSQWTTSVFSSEEEGSIFPPLSYEIQTVTFFIIVGILNLYCSVFVTYSYVSIDRLENFKADSMAAGPLLAIAGSVPAL